LHDSVKVSSQDVSDNLSYALSNGVVRDVAVITDKFALLPNNVTTGMIGLNGGSPSSIFVRQLRAGERVLVNGREVTQLVGQTAGVDTFGAPLYILSLTAADNGSFWIVVLDNGSLSKIPVASVLPRTAFVIGSIAVSGGVVAGTFTDLRAYGSVGGNNFQDGTAGISITGNAATVTTNANLTGGVTSVGNVATVVTNANLTGDVTSVGNVTSLPAVLLTPGTFGSPSSVPTLTVNAKGQVVAISAATISQLQPHFRVVFCNGGTVTVSFSTGGFTPMLALGAISYVTITVCQWDYLAQSNIGSSPGIAGAGFATHYVGGGTAVSASSNIGAIFNANIGDTVDLFGGLTLGSEFGGSATTFLITAWQ
jgi:hypothetical protein